MKFSTRVHYFLVLLITFEASRICMSVDSMHTTGGRGDDISCNQNCTQANTTCPGGCVCAFLGNATTGHCYKWGDSEPGSAPSTMDPVTPAFAE
uniref:Evasin n=1 Tax=Rhipicephalus zambeziensis TaxID=60191 RepID=A0A224YCB5_9ACAR